MKINHILILWISELKWKECGHREILVVSKTKVNKMKKMRRTRRGKIRPNMSTNIQLRTKELCDWKYGDRKIKERQNGMVFFFFMELTRESSGEWDILSQRQNNEKKKKPKKNIFDRVESASFHFRNESVSLFFQLKTKRKKIENIVRIPSVWCLA